MLLPLRRSTVSDSTDIFRSIDGSAERNVVDENKRRLFAEINCVYIKHNSFCLLFVVVVVVIVVVIVVVAAAAAVADPAMDKIQGASSTSIHSEAKLPPKSERPRRESSSSLKQTHPASRNNSSHNSSFSCFSISVIIATVNDGCRYNGNQQQLNFSAKVSAPSALK